MSSIDETDDVSAQLRQLKQLTREIDNFRDIAKYILPTPGETPRLDGVDIFGGVLPLSGSVGGDHLIYVDFKQRFDLDARIALARQQGRFDVVENLEWCRRKAGIALVDVSGHRQGLTRTVGLALPDSVHPVDRRTVEVTVDIRPEETMQERSSGGTRR